MKSIFLFDIISYKRSTFTYVSALFLLLTGIFTGNQFNLTVGNGVYLNSPYTIGFMLGMLSLSVIFIATVYGAQLLFKEWDTKFDPIVFSTPISKRSFAVGRFLSLFTLTLISFSLMAAGFTIGQYVRGGADMQQAMHIDHYLYPLFVFGCINSLFVCSFLCFVAWTTKNKLLVAAGGLLLYVLYMVILLFSNSPFMAQSMPQSLTAQQISALADPFGLSAYFQVSKDFTVLQRNTLVTPLSGCFLANRVMVMAASLLFITAGYKGFSYKRRKNKQVNKKYAIAKPDINPNPLAYITTVTRFNTRTWLQSVLSFVKMDMTYIFKSIPLIITSIILLFNLGMEMYAEIEKGIRLPQKYASSGLMATTISENFHLLGLLLTVYFVNDICWRSDASGFSTIENATVFSKSKLLGHWLSSSALLLFFTLLTITLGIIFQIAYQYPAIDLNAYGGVVVFNTFPLLLLAGFLLLINKLINHKYLSLGLSLVATLFLASPLANKVITVPLFRFFSGYRGVYSDFNGYGIYLSSFVQRLIFGACLVAIVWCLYTLIKHRKVNALTCAGMLMLACTGLFFGRSFMTGYVPKKQQAALIAAVNYEKKYRKYQAIAQPAVTDVKTQINLYPGKNSYTVEGEYIVKNLTSEPINKILINFNEDFEISQATFFSANESFNIHNAVTELTLQHPLQPNDSARFQFQMSYHWTAVNGHQSFNAIIENGSFMRISRYYPQLGYQSKNEITDERQREKYGIGIATQVRKLDELKTAASDFIYLDMIVSTEQNQISIGTGELVKQWKEGDRNYFHYKTTDPVPFRFAVSSAVYKMKRVEHNGIAIQIFYHPAHEENVDHLIQNAGLTLDYCGKNFGLYPFRSINFAEVSSFTKGFAATAYPAAIFMAEDMTFHANIKADKQQDVINELAGHELSHLWWGNNQIAPDDREGAEMLTETLAMYTEMMLYKKMHGNKKMLERINVHQQIYDAEKGFSTVQPLYKVTDGNTHISYSKGAIVMVQLSELIGENKVNEALANFLRLHKYPNPRPISTDLINEILKVSELKYHKKIREMFMGIQ